MGKGDSFGDFGGDFSKTKKLRVPRKKGQAVVYDPIQIYNYKSRWARFIKGLELYEKGEILYTDVPDKFRFLSGRSPEGYWEVQLGGGASAALGGASVPILYSLSGEIKVPILFKVETGTSVKLYLGGDRVPVLICEMTLGGGGGGGGASVTETTSSIVAGVLANTGTAPRLWPVFLPGAFSFSAGPYTDPVTSGAVLTTAAAPYRHIVDFTNAGTDGVTATVTLTFDLGIPGSATGATRIGTAYTVVSGGVVGPRTFVPIGENFGIAEQPFSKVVTFDFTIGPSATTQVIFELTATGSPTGPLKGAVTTNVTYSGGGLPPSITVSGYLSASPGKRVGAILWGESSYTNIEYFRFNGNTLTVTSYTSPSPATTDPTDWRSSLAVYGSPSSSGDSCIDAYRSQTEMNLDGGFRYRVDMASLAGVETANVTADVYEAQYTSGMSCTVGTEALLNPEVISLGDSSAVILGASAVREDRKYACTCPDYTKQQGALFGSEYNSEKTDRDWTASQAGADGDCKHIWALRISFNDLPQDFPPNDEPVPRPPSPTVQRREFRKGLKKALEDMGIAKKDVVTLLRAWDEANP